MKFTLVLLALFFGIISHCSDSHAAVRTVTSVSYALRPCSTCKEVVYATKSACEDAAFAKAAEVGATRTTGSAVYTCITRFNVIATFYAGPPPRQAVLSWTYAPIAGFTPAEGFRIVYGTSPDALASVIQLSSPTARGYTIQNLAPGTYYFAVKSYGGGNESVLSNIISKSIL